MKPMSSPGPHRRPIPFPRGDFGFRSGQGAAIPFEDATLFGRSVIDAICVEANGPQCGPCYDSCQLRRPTFYIFIFRLAVNFRFARGVRPSDKRVNSSWSDGLSP